MENATVDVISGGSAYGSVANKLLAHNMDIRAMRREWVANHVAPSPKSMRANDIFHKEQWLQFDAIVVREALRRLRGVADLLNAGLEYNLRAVGLAKTVLQWETTSDMSSADISMDGITRAAQDKLIVKHDQLLPLFITHKDVEFSAREIAIARNNNEPIDTTNLQMAARKVAETLESLLFSGPTSALSLPTAWGNAKAYGYTSQPNRVTGSLHATWTSGSSTPATILADLLAMKQSAINNRMFGPYMVYVPTAYEKVLDQDYAVVNGLFTGTIRDRLLRVGNIMDVRVADFMPADQVLLIQMTPEVVDMAVALDPIIVPWEEQGGMLLHFKVMTVMVPRIKNTQALRSGVVHYS